MATLKGVAIETLPAYKGNNKKVTLYEKSENVTFLYIGSIGIINAVKD